MIQLKYKSKRFGQMTAEEISMCSYGLLLKINVVTGWVFPQEDELLAVLTDQFEKKLVESYDNVNTDELEYAIRTYGTTVKDWGKQMNLSLIDEVMIPYLAKRKELSAIEEQKKVPMIEHKEDLSDTAMEDWMNDLRKQLKGNYNIEFLPVMLYEWLEKKERLKVDAKSKWAYLKMAVQYRQGQLEKQYADTGDNKILTTFMQMKTTGEFLGDETDRLKTIAKKMILNDYLLKQENGKDEKVQQV